jgi:hypothetical protein
MDAQFRIPRRVPRVDMEAAAPDALQLLLLFLRSILRSFGGTVLMILSRTLEHQFSICRDAPKTAHH